MQVTLKVDGNCGLHSKVIELPDEIKGMSSITVGGIDYSLFTQYDVDTGVTTGIGYHFFAKDEDVIDLTGWTKEEGGYTEARDKLAKLMERWDEELEMDLEDLEMEMKDLGDGC